MFTSSHLIISKKAYKCISQNVKLLLYCLDHLVWESICLSTERNKQQWFALVCAVKKRSTNLIFFLKSLKIGTLNSVGTISFGVLSPSNISSPTNVMMDMKMEKSLMSFLNWRQTKKTKWEKLIFLNRTADTQLSEANSINIATLALYMCPSTFLKLWFPLWPDWHCEMCCVFVHWFMDSQITINLI